MFAVRPLISITYTVGQLKARIYFLAASFWPLSAVPVFRVGSVCRSGQFHLISINMAEEPPRGSYTIKYVCR